MTQEQQDVLEQISIKMHPHLGKDNHTNELIKKVINKEELRRDELFDCGKYYSRMLEYTDEVPNSLSAILAFKWLVYNPKSNF